jgi:hypothetical protein
MRSRKANEKERKTMTKKQIDIGKTRRNTGEGRKGIREESLQREGE